jgi:signal transduction histidine kinase
VPFLGDWCNILILDGDGTVHSAAACHIDPSKTDLVRRLAPDLRLADRGVARVFATGDPIVENEIAEGSSSLSSPEQLLVLRQLDKRAYIAVPMRVRGQIIGAMTFATADPLRRYDDEDVTLATDLAQRAALAMENQRLYRASKEAVALRDEFISVASHELRTPVTSLQLAVQSALSVGDGGPPGFLRQALESAVRQTRRLGRLVDALLDVSRIQAGRLELQREPMDLLTLLREVTALMADDAGRAGCALQLTTDEPVLGRWDKARLEQVVINLLSNAIKYGAGAPISVAARSDGARARLEVRDGGIGVAAAERGRIFERFERAVSARHYGGLGLGLYIVQRIVDAHGGHVVVESAPGEGARFIVELPL